MLSSIEVPEALQRNTKNVAAAGYDYTGQILINYITRIAGLDDLKNVDVMDVGCGVRFAAAIINRNIPIKTYTGIDIYKPLIDFLKENVESKDKRFKFAHWNVYNRMYNINGSMLSTQDELPVDETFDLIWLCSVFTHQYPEDSLCLLKLLRKYIRSNGKLVFSAFIDDNLVGFEDRDRYAPLLMAFYGKKHMQSLVELSGWKVDTFCDRDAANWIQSHFVCSPNHE